MTNNKVIRSDFEAEAERILSGVYARAADNNGNSDYFHEGYPDYDTDEALRLLIGLHQQEMERIIGIDEQELSPDGVRQKQGSMARNSLRRKQRIRANLSNGKEKYHGRKV